VGEALMRAEDIGSKVSELAHVQSRVGPSGEHSVMIEHATVGDAADILDLQRLAYQIEAERYQDWTMAPLTQTLDELAHEFETHCILKVMSGSKLIGSVRATLKQGTCFIGRLIVDPRWQNRGIGAQLVTAIEGCFEEAQRYELFTGDKSERNLHLYQKLGYSPFRSEKLNEKVTLVFLEKEHCVVG
jgi:GNAT superfamily N-acetyltransferase